MEERNEKIGMIMANYAELQKRDDGELNALIKREDWNKIIMEILEWHDSEVKKLNIPDIKRKESEEYRTNARNFQRSVRPSHD